MIALVVDRRFSEGSKMSDFPEGSAHFFHRDDDEVEPDPDLSQNAADVDHIITDVIDQEAWWEEIFFL